MLQNKKKSKEHAAEGKYSFGPLFSTILIIIHRSFYFCWRNSFHPFFAYFSSGIISLFKYPAIPKEILNVPSSSRTYLRYTWVVNKIGHRKEYSLSSGYLGSSEVILATEGISRGYCVSMDVLGLSTAWDYIRRHPKDVKNSLACLLS